MQNFTLSKQFFRDVWYLTKSYWQSEEKKKAFFLLACIVGLTLAIVYMLVLLSHHILDLDLQCMKDYQLLNLIVKCF